MDYNSYFPLINSYSHSNNVFNAQQVQAQLRFQERMSNTSHQREVADLKAAGLNPVLSAGGSGAAAMQGAAATADNSNVAALSNILGTVLNNENARAIAAMNNSAAARLQAQTDSAAMDRAMFSAKQNQVLQSQKIQAERDLQDAKLAWQTAQNNFDRIEKDKDRKNTKEYQEAQIALRKAEYELDVKKFELQSLQLQNVSRDISGSGSTSSPTTSASSDNDNIYGSDIYGHILSFSQDYIDSLNPNGTTTILGIRVPNKFIITYWNRYVKDHYTENPRSTNENSSENYSGFGGFVRKHADKAAEKRGTTVKELANKAADIRALGAK